MKKIYFLVAFFVLFSVQMRGQVVFSDSFEGDAFNGWVTLDIDNDGRTWNLRSADNTTTARALTGTGYAYSRSWLSEVGALTPDNWLISPEIVIPDSNYALDYWVSAMENAWPNEHYGVYITTSQNYTDTNSYSLLFEETLSTTTGGTTDQGVWQERTVSLQSYAGQTVRIAFRHFNCTDMVAIVLDDVTVQVQEDTPSEPEVERPCASTYVINETVCSEYPVYNSQTFLMEGFEGGAIPDGWTTSGSGSWSVAKGDYSTSTGTHSGSYNAKITHSTNGYKTKLISPELDMTAFDNVSLSFWYINRNWSSDIDGFAVYYRTSGNSSWVQVFSTTDNHESWTEGYVTLPGTATQLAFEMTDGWGYGVGLDDIILDGRQLVNTYTENGTYVYTMINENGCEDTVTLNLTVQNNRPIIHTFEVDNVKAFTAECGGEVFTDCNYAITERGLCYSTTPNPTIEDNRLVNSDDNPSFSGILTGLTEGTTYYVRAYATNSMGVAYGGERSFTTLHSAAVNGLVTDATTNNPIAGAYVSVFFVGDNQQFMTTVVTDASGHYSVSNLVEGGARFAANASGYDNTSMGTQLAPGNGNVVNLTLTPSECQAPVNVDYQLVSSNGETSLQLTWEMEGDTMTQESSYLYYGSS